jgi:predicted alpha/beta-fold hydrolase
VYQSSVPTIDHDFRPHPLLRSGHAQTIAAVLRKPTGIAYAARQHVITTTEDDQLVLHEDDPADGNPAGGGANSLCALLVHGLVGSHQSPYMVRIADKLRRRGIRVFRLDMRGCGSGVGLARKPAHAGRSEDVAAAVRFIANRYPEMGLVLVGFSLGGNQLLKMLGEWGEEGPEQVLRAMAISPPIDLVECSQHISRPRCYLYNRWFLRWLIQSTRERNRLVPDGPSIDLTPPPTTLVEFDERVTAPLSGFAGAADYYARTSSLAVLPRIKTPTMILTADDDPIVPGWIFRSVPESPQLSLRMPSHGGHVAFLGTANGDADGYWLDWRVVQFVVDAGRPR